MEPISLAERLLRTAWGFHFRIPEAAEWILLAAGLWLFLRDERNVALAIVAVGVVGITRWEWHRWRSRGGLVVPLFATSPQQRGRDAEPQRVILASLRDKLPPEVARLVHGIPVVVGPDDRDFALRLRRRLRAAFLLHGRIADADEGGWSVYARVMQPASGIVRHYDLHTSDVTPVRARWAPLIDRLTPAIDVLDEEYPFREFAAELEAIMKGTAGQLALTFNDYSRAEQWLAEAISISPDSTSHQIDKLRVDLARAVAEQGRPDEGMTILRKRARQDDASPELLRTVHRLLFARHVIEQRESTPEEEAEALEALHRAAGHQTDPQRPMTLYNLLMMVFRPEAGPSQEGAEILAELLTTRSHYRGAWYVKRLRGLVPWYESERLVGEGREVEARAAAREAAKWYSRAIRARPKLKLISLEGPRLILFRRFQRSAVLHANAFDAHRRAGNRARAWLHLKIAAKVRWRRFTTGMEAFVSGQWDRAYAYLDWSVVGWNDDTEKVASLYRCIALRQRGFAEAADQEWQHIRNDSRLRALATEIEHRHNLPHGLPGS